jgi:hypothetical protein
VPRAATLPFSQKDPAEPRGGLGILRQALSGKLRRASRLSLRSAASPTSCTAWLSLLLAKAFSFRPSSLLRHAVPPTSSAIPERKRSRASDSHATALLPVTGSAFPKPVGAGVGTAGVGVGASVGGGVGVGAGRSPMMP